MLWHGMCGYMSHVSVAVGKLVCFVSSSDEAVSPFLHNMSQHCVWERERVIAQCWGWSVEAHTIGLCWTVMKHHVFITGNTRLSFTQGTVWWIWRGRFFQELKRISMECVFSVLILVKLVSCCARCSVSSLPTVTAPSSPLSPPVSPTLSTSELPSAGKNGECTVCFDQEVDTVIYTCGHMCLCNDCGLKLKRQINACCPICRRPIKDVIKTYRPWSSRSWDSQVLWQGPPTSQGTDLPGCHLLRLWVLPPIGEITHPRMLLCL